MQIFVSVPSSDSVRTRTSGSPAATLAARQPTERFPFDSHSGPPPSAANSQDSASLPTLYRSMIGTSSAASGTVRGRLFLSVSTCSLPPPSLACTARAVTSEKIAVQLTCNQTG